MQEPSQAKMQVDHDGVTRDKVYQVLNALDSPLTYVRANLACKTEGRHASLRHTIRFPLWAMILLLLLFPIFGAGAIWSMHAGGNVSAKTLPVWSVVIAVLSVAMSVGTYLLFATARRRLRSADPLLETSAGSDSIRAGIKRYADKSITLLACTTSLKISRGGRYTLSPAVLIFLRRSDELIPITIFPSGLTILRKDRLALEQFAMLAGISFDVRGISTLDCGQIKLNITWNPIA